MPHCSSGLNNSFLSLEGVAHPSRQKMEMKSKITRRVADLLRRSFIMTGKPGEEAVT
jgi:hypothetical protein